MDETHSRNFLEKLGVSPRIAGITRVATVIAAIVTPPVTAVAAWQFNRFATAFDGMQATLGTLKTTVALGDQAREMMEKQIATVERKSEEHARSISGLDRRLTAMEAVWPRRSYVPLPPGTELTEPWNRDKR